MANIFISYRREDTGGYAGRLYDRLADHFGREHIFIDVDTLEPGEDFMQVIQEKVASCDALVAVIGTRWLSTDETGQRRLDDEHDVVRLEIVAALERKVRVVPALVDGARMPRPQELPEAMVALGRRNALDVSNTLFGQSVEVLIKTLDKIVRPLQPIQSPSSPSATIKPRSPKQKASEDTSAIAKKGVAALKDLKRAHAKAQQLDEELKTLKKRSAQEKVKAEREIQRLSNELNDLRSSSEANLAELQRMIGQIRVQKAKLQRLKKVKQDNDQLLSEVNSLKSELQRLNKIRKDRVRAILDEHIVNGILVEPQLRSSLTAAAAALNPARSNWFDHPYDLPSYIPLAVDSKTGAHLKFFFDHLEYSNEPDLEASYHSLILPLWRRHESSNWWSLPYIDFHNLTFKATRSGVSVSDGKTIESAVDPDKLVKILETLKI